MRKRRDMWRERGGEGKIRSMRWRWEEVEEEEGRRERGGKNAIRDLPPVTHFPLLEPITYILECSKTVLPLGDQVLRHE